MRKPKDYTGQKIRHYLVLEEIDTGLTFSNAQDKHNKRTFRALNTQTGKEEVHPMHYLKNSQLQITDGDIKKIGKTYGNWKIVKPVLTSDNGTPEKKWLFRNIKTGEEMVSMVKNLPKRGYHSDHGARKKNVSPRTKKIYIAWMNIKAKCYNPNSHSFNNWGALGYRMCDEWKNSFASFEKELSGMRERKRREILMPIDGKIYSPGNIHWVIRKAIDEPTTKQS